jgi:hypothetical protein
MKLTSRGWGLTWWWKCVARNGKAVGERRKDNQEKSNG